LGRKKSVVGAVRGALPHCAKVPRDPPGKGGRLCEGKEESFRLIFQPALFISFPRFRLFSPFPLVFAFFALTKIARGGTSSPDVQVQHKVIGRRGETLSITRHKHCKPQSSAIIVQLYCFPLRLYLNQIKSIGGGKISSYNLNFIISSRRRVQILQYLIFPHKINYT